MEFQLNSQLDDIENAFGCPDEDYCNCRSSQAKEAMQTLCGCKDELEFPPCNLEVCNPRPMANATEPEPGSHERIMETLFPEGLPDQPLQIARDMYQEKKDQEPIGVMEIDLEPEPEPVAPIAAAILNRLLNREELAAKLLVPEEKED